MSDTFTLSSDRTVPLEDGMVSVIDDDEMVRRSLERLLRSWRMRVKTYASGSAFLAAREKGPHSGPSCLILDLCMPGEDGLHLQTALSDQAVPIIFLSGKGDVPSCATAMKAGAVDFLTKPVDEDKLMSVVNAALRVSHSRQKLAEEQAEARGRFRTLTAREAEVMSCVISGMLNKQIAHRLGTAEKTIKIHRGRVMAKMEVSSVADLVRCAQSIGFAPSQS